jgi:hypothetical protein
MSFRIRMLAVLAGTSLWIAPASSREIGTFESARDTAKPEEKATLRPVPAATPGAADSGGKGAAPEAIKHLPAAKGSGSAAPAAKAPADGNPCGDCGECGEGGGWLCECTDGQFGDTPFFCAAEEEAPRKCKCLHRLFGRRHNKGPKHEKATCKGHKHRHKKGDCDGYAGGYPWGPDGSWQSFASFDGGSFHGDVSMIVPSEAEPPVVEILGPATVQVVVPQPVAPPAPVVAAPVAAPRPAPALVAPAAQPVGRVLASAPSRQTRPSTEEIQSLASSRPSDVLLTRGFSHYWAGRYSDALAHFEGALVKDPANPQTWYGKALAERAIGERQAASASLARAVRLQREVNISDADFNFLMERLPSADKSWVSAARSGD